MGHFCPQFYLINSWSAWQSPEPHSTDKPGRQKCHWGLWVVFNCACPPPKGAVKTGTNATNLGCTSKPQVFLQIMIGLRSHGSDRIDYPEFSLGFRSDLDLRDTRSKILEGRKFVLLTGEYLKRKNGHTVKVYKHFTGTSLKNLTTDIKCTDNVSVMV